MKKILLLIILIGLPASMEAQIQPRTKNVNVKAEIKQDITVKDEAAIQKQDFLESQAAGAAVAAMILKKYKNKFEEAQLMYEDEPSIENAFELANYSKKLFGAGLSKDRFGPITKEHKILVVKYKGKYKKYKKKN